MSPKRGAYPAEIRRTALRMLREGREPREVMELLGVTSTTLRVWTLQAKGISHRPARSRDSVIALTVQAYERLDELLRTAPRSALEWPMGFSPEAIDHWRVKDAMAHVAHYKALVAKRLLDAHPGLRAREGPVERRLEEYWDPESWAELESADKVLKNLDAKTRRRHRVNHLVYLRWRHRAGSEIVAWHTFVQEHLVSLLQNGPDEWFLPDDQRASRGSLSHEAVGTLTTHSDQHLRDMRRALNT